MSAPAVIWLDMHLLARLFDHIAARTATHCVHFTGLAMQRSPDEHAFLAARDSNAVDVTKGANFAGLLHRLDPPPAVVWLRCGNCSTEHPRDILDTHLSAVLGIIRFGAEITDRPMTSPGPGRTTD